MTRFYGILLLTFGLSHSLAAQCPITVDAGEDIYLCTPPTPTQLDGSISGDYLSFSWTPTAGLSGINTLTPTVNVTTNMTYVLTGNAANLNNNLIVNGDFGGGNYGFSSDYVYSPGDLVPEGYYDVIDNPQLDHPGFAPCEDHTGGGNMMAVNGAGSPNQDVWCQTVAVTPNTQYVFSAWVTTLVASSPAILQFSINGMTIGSVFNAPSTLCTWQNFFTTWNSGANTTADICIVNQNTVLGGNDFALDDLLFAPICKVTDTVKVFSINVKAVATAIYTIPCEGINITLDGTGSSTGPDITYQWDTGDGNIVSGANTLHPVVNQPGQYTLTVTFEKNGFICEKTATVNVIQNPNPFSAWITQPNPLGCGSPNITIFGNTSQPGVSSYQWSTSNGNIVSGSTSKNVVVNQPGIYELVATNITTGCTATAEVTVTTATNPPVSNANATGIITCTQTTVPLSGAGSTTGANISYLWTSPNGAISGPANGQNAIANSAGTFILAVTNNSNNCTAYDTVQINANTTLPTISLATPGVLDCDTDTLTLSANVNPANAVVNWTASPGGTIVSGANTTTPAVTTAGTYTLSVVNSANGCSQTSPVTVTSNYTPPSAVILPPDTITCQQPSLALSGTGSSSGANFTYNWTGSNGGNVVSGANTLNPIVNTPGNYALVVTNTINACTAIANAQVKADTNIVLAIANAPDTLTCAVGSVNLNTNGSSSGASLTYNWTTADGLIQSGQNGPNPVVLLPGTYQLLLSNSANGCSATDVAVVVQDTLSPKISISTPGLLTCANPVQVIQAQNNAVSGSFSYAWSGPAPGSIVSGGNTLTPSVKFPGTYILTTTNLATGCTSTQSVLVDQQAGVPVVTASVPAILNCTNPALFLSSAGSSTGGNFIYQWSTNGGNIVSGGNGPSPKVDAPGTYTLLITNNNNGCTATASVQVAQDTLHPKLLVQPPAVITCYQPAETLMASNLSLPGNFSYQWNVIGAGNIVNGANSLTPQVSAGGLYRLSVTNNSNGCVSTLLVAVDSNISTPALNILPTAKIDCAHPDQTIQAQNLSLPGNFSYSWTAGNGGNILSGSNLLNPTVNASGKYTLLVTNLINGCTNTQSTNLSVDTIKPVFNIGFPDTIKCKAPQVTLNAQNQSPAGNYTYAWTSSNGGNLVSGANTLQPTVDAAGNYQLLVTNTQNSCTSTHTVPVSVNKILPSANAGADDTLSCAVNSLSLNGFGSGNASVVYNWSATQGGNILSGANSTTPSINAAGLYTLTVTNLVNGCTASDAVQIFNDVNAPIATAGTAPVLSCKLAQFNLNGSGSTGANISYSWSTQGGGNILSGTNTLQPLVNQPGTYLLTVHNNSNGCTAVSAVNVLQDITKPVVSAGAKDTLTCAKTTLTLHGTASATNGGTLQFLWSGPGVVSEATTLTPVINQNGSYQLLVTNNLNGCSETAQTQISIDTLKPVFAIAQPGILTCTKTLVTLNASITTPSTGFVPGWTTQNGHIVSNAASNNIDVDKPGIYQLKVQNNKNGCTSIQTVSVTQNIVKPAAQAQSPSIITCKNPIVAISGAGSSAGTSFLYNWDTNNGHIVNGGTTLAPTVDVPGTYTITVTDQTNGCTATANTLVNKNTNPPVIKIQIPAMLTCAVTTLPITGVVTQPPSGFTPVWSSANGQFVSGQNSLIPVVNQTGTYNLIVTDEANGCTSTASTTVSQNIISPGAEAGPPAELNCNDKVAVLAGSSPSSGTLAYAWTSPQGHFVSGQNSPQPNVDKPGAYKLTVTDTNNGCTDQDSVLVFEVLPPVFEVKTVQPTCLAPKGALNIEAVSGGEPPYTYSANGGQNYQASAAFNQMPAGAYTLAVLDGNGCSTTRSATLKEPVYPTLQIDQLEVLDLGDSIQLAPNTNLLTNQIGGWTWTPAEYLSCDKCPNPFTRPFKNIKYAVTVHDLIGCTATASVQIRIQKRRDIYAPNIFSPNGDGENDRFTLYGKGVKEIHFLRIFDRWGTELYAVEHIGLNDESLGWDGKFKGSDLNPAVFVWVAQVEFLDGTIETLTGDVTIDR